MVKKVKRFIVFVLFSFFYSLLASKAGNATYADVYAVKNVNGVKKILYQGRLTNMVPEAAHSY